MIYLKLLARNLSNDFVCNEEFENYTVNFEKYIAQPINLIKI